VSSRSLHHFACLADRSNKARQLLQAVQRHIPDIMVVDSRTPIGEGHALSEQLSQCDAFIVLGGDGFMLHSLHQYMHLNIPFYGLNAGTIGFLMNGFPEESSSLRQHIADAKQTIIHPLRMNCQTKSGECYHALAINEVSLLREVNQAAKIRIMIDQEIRISQLVCDGILVATSAGSTAYNLSAGGSIIPLGSNVLALTPISPFRPRRWRGALLPHHVHIRLDVLEPRKRPVSVMADFHAIRDVEWVEIVEEKHKRIRLLFDAAHSLEERIFKEQFVH
jgi:NAD+ kinase